MKPTSKGALFVLLAGLAAAFAPAVEAQTGKLGIRSVHRSGRDATRLFVILEAPVPEAGRVSDPGVWEVRAIRPGEPPLLLKVQQAATDRTYLTTRRVTLHVQQAVPADALRVEVLLRLDNQPTGATRPPEDAKPAFEAVDDPDDATVYFSGIVAPAVGAHTLYTIDARADVTLARFGATQGMRLSATGVFKADERPDVDPDSARLGAQLQRVRGSRIWTWNVVGGEFNRKADVVNVLTAGSVIQTWARPFTRKTEDAGTILTSALNVEAALGVEVGANLRNTVDVASDDGDDGSGAILRIVPSAGVWWTKRTPFLDRIVLSSQYTLRVPTTREIFLETRDLPDDADPVPSLTRKARHHLAASAAFMLTDYFGVEAGYEFGSLPPVFQFVDHSFSFGLTFMMKQNQ